MREVLQIVVKTLKTEKLIYLNILKINYNSILLQISTLHMKCYMNEYYELWWNNNSKKKTHTLMNNGSTHK